MHYEETTAVRPWSFISTNAFSVDQQSGKVNVNFFGSLNLNGNDIINVRRIIGMDGKWKIDSDGTLMAVRVITDEVIAKNVKTETLCVGSTCITEEQLVKLLNGQGISSTSSENNLSSIIDNSSTATTTEPVMEPVPEETATSTTP